jgi:hypothetical protein
MISKKSSPLKPLGQMNEKLTDDGRQTTDNGRQVMAKAHIAFGKVS